MLQLKLFGQFNIEIDGQPAGIPTRPAQALLAYLALNAGILHRRERLAGIFWPDASETNARSNLRRALWRIRGSINPDHLITDNVSVTFDAASDYWLDVEVLATSVDENAAPADQIKVLMDAVSVYRGELLPGFYENWVMLERERLSSIYEQQIIRLVDQLAAGRRWQDVLLWSERWLAFGQAPEQAYRALMVAHAELGNQAGVVAAYQRCVEALRTNLDVDTSLETSALYERLASGETFFRAGIATAKRDRGEDAGSDEPFRVHSPAFLDGEAASFQTVKDPFVQRERELSRLDSFLDKALAGQTQVALITGGAGRGKTRLLDEFVRRAQEAHGDLIVAPGHCTAYAGVGDPYLPFRDVLAVLAGNVEAKCAAGAMAPQHALRLWQLLPHTLEALLDDGPDLIDIFVAAADLLRRARAALPDSSPVLARLAESTAQKQHGDVELEQRFLFNQYVSVLQNLAARHPLLITLDDLQWADAASISLLFHLSRRLAGSRVLIVGAYRSDEVLLDGEGKRHPLQKVLAEVKRVYGDVWIELAQTQTSEGRAFVESLVDAEPNRLDDTFRNDLFRLTDGHPLFTIELLRELKTRGDLVRDGDGFWTESPTLNWQVLPARVEGVIEERLGRLDPNLRRLLAVASVEGETFTAEVLAKLMGIDPLQLLHFLSHELQTRYRLVSEQEEVQAGDHLLSRYRFSHILFQQYLYRSLSVGERRLLHTEIGLVLETIHVGHTAEIAPQLLHHFRTAGNREKAVEYARTASQHAKTVYAYDEAIQHLQTALTFFADGQQIDIQLALVEDLADMHGLINRNSEAIFLYRTAFELCLNQINADPSVLVRLHCKIFERAFEIRWFAGLEESVKFDRTLAESRLVLEEALAQDQSDLSPLERVHALTTLVNDARISLRLDDRYEATKRYARLAVETAEEYDLPVALSDALLALSGLYYARGLLPEQLEIAGRQMTLIRDPRFSNVRKRLVILEKVSQILIQAGEYSMALAHLLEIRIQASEIGSIANLARALGDEGHSLFQLDRWDELFEVHAEYRALALRYPAEQIPAMCFFISLCATAHALRGHAKLALALREEAHKIMVRATGEAVEHWTRDQHY